MSYTHPWILPTHNYFGCSTYGGVCDGVGGTSDDVEGVPGLDTVEHFGMRYCKLCGDPVFYNSSNCDDLCHILGLITCCNPLQ